jgi:hypothetical protein
VATGATPVIAVVVEEGVARLAVAETTITAA